MPRFAFPWRKFSFGSSDKAEGQKKNEPARVSATERQQVTRRSSVVEEQTQRTRSTSSQSPEMFSRSASCDEARNVSPLTKATQRGKGESFPKVNRREFEVRRILGEGSFGQVLLTSWQGRKVALKVLKEEEQFDGQLEEAGVAYDDIIAAFHQEISLMECVGRHPTIVEIFAKGTDGRTLAMECARSDIYHMVKKVGATLPLELCAHWARQLLSGIDYIHSQGVVHQDIKSSNILIFESGAAKICDFGLAVKGKGRMVVDRELLTLWYRAPELMMGARVYSPRVDEWGAGCILLEMLLGHVAFPGNASSGCACNRVSHTNFNRDQLGKIFKMLGSPSDDAVQDLSCWRHFQAWPRYKPRLAQAIAEAIDHRPASAVAAGPGPATGTGNLNLQSSLDALLPPPSPEMKPQERRRSSLSGGVKAIFGSTGASTNTTTTTSSSSSPHQQPVDGAGSLKEAAAKEAAAALWLDVISRLLTILPDRRNSAAQLLQRPLFAPAAPAPADDVAMEDALPPTPERRSSSHHAHPAPHPAAGANHAQQQQQQQAAAAAEPGTARRRSSASMRSSSSSPSGRELRAPPTEDRMQVDDALRHAPHLLHSGGKPTPTATHFPPISAAQPHNPQHRGSASSSGPLSTSPSSSAATREGEGVHRWSRASSAADHAAHPHPPQQRSGSAVATASGPPEGGDPSSWLLERWLDDKGQHLEPHPPTHPQQRPPATKTEGGSKGGGGGAGHVRVGCGHEHGEQPLLEIGH